MVDYKFKDIYLEFNKILIVVTDPYNGRDISLNITKHQDLIFKYYTIQPAQNGMYCDIIQTHAITLE